MTTPIVPVPPAPSQPAAGGRPARRRGVRRAVALTAAGGLLASVLGFAAPASAGAVVLTGWTYGGGAAADGWSGTSGSTGPWSQGGSGSSTATADAQPATSTQEKGVALIDTVLTDGAAAGTGIVLTSDGEVLTNYHVVEGSTSVRVTIASTGKTYTAAVVGADQSADIALLQLRDASGLTVSTIDDDTVALGDDVTAVGNAGGTGALSAADGEVTDLSSSITTESEGSVAGEALTRLIETDADVVAGDSGGPLLDAEGEVVGVDTAASSGAEIDGYAIPIATALAVVSQIRGGDDSATVRVGPAAFLGVELSTTLQSAYPGRGTDTADATAGALVAGVVDGGAAEAAGLAAGDTITRVGSTSVAGADDLTSALAGHEPGDKVTLTWTTAAGQTGSASVTLGASPVN